ncbi:hypothetical protein [Hydrocarboniphaga sp.]|uniref:hypothetical protein n=1 Tax=Hydrocarboniphaga sp. TaxID=2033016 RepID=UPI003D12101C
MATTSLKLPEDVKRLAAAAAKLRGISSHAFMVEAIREVASAEERRAAFVAQAVEARAETLRTGSGHPAAEVHDYLQKRAQGKKPPRPAARPWRS